MQISAIIISLISVFLTFIGLYYSKKTYDNSFSYMLKRNIFLESAKDFDLNQFLRVSRRVDYIYQERYSLSINDISELFKEFSKIIEQVETEIQYIRILDENEFKKIIKKLENLEDEFGDLINNCFDSDVDSIVLKKNVVKIKLKVDIIAKIILSVEINKKN